MYNSILRQIRISLFIMIVSALVIYFENYRNLSIGKYIYQCTDDPAAATSYPCHAPVDMSIIVLMVVIIIILFLAIIIKAFRFWQSK